MLNVAKRSRNISVGTIWVNYSNFIISASWTKKSFDQMSSSLGFLTNGRTSPFTWLMAEANLSFNWAINSACPARATFAPSWNSTAIGCQPQFYLFVLLFNLHLATDNGKFIDYRLSIRSRVFFHTKYRFYIKVGGSSLAGNRTRI